MNSTSSLTGLFYRHTPTPFPADPFLTRGSERLPLLLLGPPSRQMTLIHHGVEVARAAAGARIVYSGPGPWPSSDGAPDTLQVNALTAADAWVASAVATCTDLADLRNLMTASRAEPQPGRPTWLFLRTEQLAEHLLQVVHLRHHNVRTVIVSTGDRIGHTYALQGDVRFAHHLIDTTIDWRPSLDWPADRDDAPEPARVYHVRADHPRLWSVPSPTAPTPLPAGDS